MNDENKKFLEDIDIIKEANEIIRKRLEEKGFVYGEELAEAFWGRPTDEYLDFSESCNH